MKTLKTLAFVLAILTGVPAFSNEGDNPSPKIEKAFQQYFSGATGAKWTVQSNYVAVRFGMSHSSITAYFTHDGELIGSARSLLFNDLPVIPMKAVLERFPGATPYEVIEYNVDQSTSYVMTIETASKVLRVQVSVGGETAIIKKTNK